MENITSPQETPQATSGTPQDILNIFEEEQVIPQQPGSISEPANQEIDPRFLNLSPEEAQKRTEQSRYDKLQAEYNKALQLQEEHSKYVAFMNELMEDDELLDAFLYERKPELVKSRDIDTIIAEKLKAEFGDYTPDPNEVRTPGVSKAWRYEKRAEQIYTELLNKNSDKNLTVKELRQRREQKKQEEQVSFQRELEQIKRENNWSDVEIRNFYDFTQKLDMRSFVKIYKYALRNSQRINPNIVNHPGQTINTSARERFLSTL